MTYSRRVQALIFLSQAESLTPRGRRLIDEKLGGPENALEGFSYEICRLTGDKAYRELAAARDRGVDRLIEDLDRADIRAVSMDDEEYPERLRNIPDAPELQTGEVGAFIVGNETYIKALGADGLESLNPAYPVMHFDESASVYLIGRVIGILDPKQIAQEADVEKYRLLHPEGR